MSSLGQTFMQHQQATHSRALTTAFLFAMIKLLFVFYIVYVYIQRKDIKTLLFDTMYSWSLSAPDFAGTLRIAELDSYQKGVVFQFLAVTPPY